jgi:hypothetical protein
MKFSNTIQLSPKFDVVDLKLKKKTNSGLQNTKQKNYIADRATRTPLKPGMNWGASEE